MEALLDLLRGGGLKEQFESVPKILPCLIDRIPLACDVHFRTKRHIAIPFPLYDCG